MTDLTVPVMPRLDVIGAKAPSSRPNAGSIQYSLRIVDRDTDSTMVEGRHRRGPRSKY
jgi:hypothetical protein